LGARGQNGLVDPFAGSVPLAFPLEDGTCVSPLVDNWHQEREGQIYPWNHRTAPAARAHDGVDIYPAGGGGPRVYAPFAATVAAVCTRSANRVDAAMRYRVSSATPPPQDYSQAIDDVVSLPLYGNFIWLLSTDPRSAGYYVFVCHLQNEAILSSLVPDQPVTPASPLGVVGDTGNAAGTPQLHVELHYPAGATYVCTHCTPARTLTSFDPFASLQLASVRLALAGAMLTPAATSAAGPAGTRTYSAGWNLVAAPAGSVFSQATDPLYTFQAGDTNYEAVPNSAGTTSGWGYWAYFPASATVALGSVSASSALVRAPAGQYVLIGNPSATEVASVRNADVLWAFDPMSGQYVSTAALAPGQGAWALSLAGATLRIGTPA
jgi:hypothetical protein